MTLRGYKILALVCCMSVHLPMNGAETTLLNTQDFFLRWATIQIQVIGKNALFPQVGIAIQPNESLSAGEIFQRALKLVRQETLTHYQVRLKYSDGRIIETLSYADLADNPKIILELYRDKEE